MSIESLVDMAALGLAAVLALQCVGRLDHRPPRSSTSGYEKKLRPLAEKLRGRLKMGPDGKPIKLSLREHEQVRHLFNVYHTSEEVERNTSRAAKK